MRCRGSAAPVVDVGAGMALTRSMEALLPIEEDTGIAAEKDPEKVSLKRMERIVPDFTLTVLPNAGHEDAPKHPLYQKTILEHLQKCRSCIYQTEWTRIRC